MMGKKKRKIKSRLSQKSPSNLSKCSLKCHKMRILLNKSMRLMTTKKKWYLLSSVSPRSSDDHTQLHETSNRCLPLRLRSPGERKKTRRRPWWWYYHIRNSTTSLRLEEVAETRARNAKPLLLPHVGRFPSARAPPAACIKTRLSTPPPTIQTPSTT